ncbi:hypothetical protein X975_18865, partial [Stegodyphus mimosarum]
MELRLIVTVLIVVWIAAVECRYPYEDTYRQGYIVPYRYKRRHIPHDRDFSVDTHHDEYNDRYNPREDSYYKPKLYSSHYYPDGSYSSAGGYRRRYRDYGPYLRPRGLGGYKKNHGISDYDYGHYRRRNSRVQRRQLDGDDINYGGQNSFTGLGIRFN